MLPCLHDWHDEGGSTRGEYFWQDLVVARMIFLAGPERHIDIGSRIDGFVAHLASFREVEIFDVRPITANIPNVTFKQVDFIQLAAISETHAGYCDSVSCLHVLEHFGLGRYGDPVKPDGYADGLGNMSALLAVGGKLYLSVPIGRERVVFNSHRVFDPNTIIRLGDLNGLKLLHLTLVKPGGAIIQASLGEVSLRDLGAADYTLGIFVFEKVKMVDFFAQEQAQNTFN